MYTPQQKGPSRWSLSPRVGDTVENGSAEPAVKPRDATGVAFGKGKGKSMAEGPPPPPRASLGGVGIGDGFGSAGEDPEVWKRFHEAGMLDESSLQKKDREALVQRISVLEKELYEYQYNMGLLLIEKKDWASNFDEVRQALAEAEETVKREQAAHLMAISDFVKREENLRKVLGIEKQCVADLEKALREMRSEIAEVKFTSEKKLNEACALEAGLGEKYLEVEEKLHKADANLAEASRKSSEIDRKLEDLEDRERKLQKEYQTFSLERKMHEKDIAEQRDYLRDWEKRLQDGHKRLIERQQVLNEREDQANELEKILKKKESELEEARKMVEAMKISLKNKEEDIQERLNSLATKEKKADFKSESLEKKEKELIAREENLESRERLEIGKLLDEHNAMLHSKEREFELDLEKRRKTFDEEMQVKMDEVETKKKEIELLEAQFIKREQALEEDLQKLSNKERDLNIKSKALKNWEDSLKNDEDNLDKEKQQLGKDKEELLKFKSELESLKAAIEAGKEQIVKEEENLRLTKEEREEHSQLQSKLKQEIEDYRMMKDSLFRDKEDLRQQRVKFEEEWELLDERKSSLDSHMNKFNDERERFENWRSNEEQRLNNETLEAKINIERELEELGQKKEAYEKTMEHEKLEVIELLKRERADMDRELELRKHELEMDMQRKQEAMEKKLNDRENDFQRKRDVELEQITSLSNLNESKIFKLKMEQDQLEREKEDLYTQRKKLEVDQLDIQKDINSLSILSRNLKDQREQFVKEKERFLTLAKQYKICKNCGHQVGELELASLIDAGNIMLPLLVFEENLEAKNTETSPMNRVSDSTTPGGRLSWLQKCSRIFNFSPGKKSEDPSQCQTSFGTKLEEAMDGEASHEPAQYGDAFDMVESDSGIRENKDSGRLVEATEEPESSFGVADNSVDVLIQTDNGVMEREGKPIVSSLHQNEREISSVPLQDDSQPESSKLKRRQPSKRSRPKPVRRTRTIKAVVEEAKAIIGDTSNENNDEQLNGDVMDSLNIQEDSQGHSVHTDMVTASVGQKRRLTQTSGIAASELDDEDSETRSESVSLGGRRKRRQVSAPGTQTAGEKRYNLRSSTIAGTSTAGQTLPDQIRGSKISDSKMSTGSEMLKEGGEAEGIAKPGTEPASEVIADSIKASQMLQQRTVESVTEIHEISSQKIIRFEEELHAHAESNNDIVVKSLEFSGRSDDDNGFVVDGTAAEAEPATPSNGEYSEDEEDMEKHNASIGKKLWTFFTT